VVEVNATRLEDLPYDHHGFDEEQYEGIVAGDRPHGQTS
jgi:hypothetical protein